MVEAAPKKFVVGIDLGTTNTCVTLWDPESKTTEILQSSEGADTTPSWVSLTEGGDVIVGERAKNELLPLRVFDAKRMIGRFFDDLHVKERMPQWPFMIASDQKGNCVISFGQETRSVEEVSAEVLKEMMKLVKQRIGEEAANDVEGIITVPAYFNSRQREATVSAARIAGLRIIRTMSEPTSAALSALYELPPREGERKLVVYDLGGGTLDVTVLHVDDDIPEVDASRGDMNLGGRDLDEKLIDLVIKKFCELNPEVYLIKEQKLKLKHRLLIECVRLKEVLSDQLEGRIRLDAAVTNPMIDLDVTITRADFE